jgi:predicted dehydrogenase
LGAGKHVLVEKPIATVLEDADAMLEAARRAERILMVGHVLHFEPAYALLRERLQRSELGRPVSIATRRHCRKTSFEHYARTHPVLHLGVHDLDLMLWFLEEQLTVMQAWERNTLGQANPDVAWVALESVTGVLCQLEVSWLLPGNSPAGVVAEMEVIGTEGTALVRSPAPTLTISGENGVQVPDTAIWPDLAGVTAGALQDELRHFLRLVAGQATFDFSETERARTALALALEAVQKAGIRAKETK